MSTAFLLDTSTNCFTLWFIVSSFSTCLVRSSTLVTERTKLLTDTTGSSPVLLNTITKDQVRKIKKKEFKLLFAKNAAGKQYKETQGKIKLIPFYTIHGCC